MTIKLSQLKIVHNTDLKMNGLSINRLHISASVLFSVYVNCPPAPRFLRPGTESRERAVRSLLFGGSRIADGTEARRTDRLREKHNERKSFQIKISHFLAFERMVSSKNKQNMSVHGRTADGLRYVLPPIKKLVTFLF